MQEELKQGKRGSWGVSLVHKIYGPHGFYPSFLHSPLYLSHLIFPPSPPLSCLALSVSCVLALAGHAAAAELFGSLGFMVAALPLSSDGLVNSDLH